MAKAKATPRSTTPNAQEVDAPVVSSEVDSIVVPSLMPGSYLTVDARMDSSPITVKFSAKEVPELVLEDIVDSSGEAGARHIDIPLDYLTKLMGFTALISYTGRAQGQAAASLVTEVGISFYPADESDDLAPHLLHEKIVHNTPTYDMRDHTGDETVLVRVPPLAKAGDKLYCTVATEQDAARHVFYTVVYDYVLTAADAVAGNVLRFSISRGWLARRKPWRSLTLQCAWITSGLPAEPPAEVDPHLETRLPRNALEIQRRRTAALIVDPGLDLKPPHLRQSAHYNGGWCLNPELTKEGGDVDAPTLDTYADDQICFYVSGEGYESRQIGCVTIEHDGDRASVRLAACIVACFFNKSLTLTYTVRFPNSEEPQPSPEQVVSVSVPQFPHPGIEEATNGILDLRTFPGDAMATVPVWAYIECAKACWMWIVGEYEDGSDYRLDILSGVPVTDDWKTHGVGAAVLRAELQKLADCSSFELHFSATFCDADDLAEAHAFPAQAFEIEQEALVLPAPEVVEAVGSDLTAWNGRNGVQVKVDYVGNNPKHSISLCWKKADGTCWPLASKPGSTAGAVIFELPAEAVIESMGKTVPITYTVNTACKVQTSPPLNLKISKPVRLPTPAVREATPYATQGGVLDLRAFAGDAHITVEKWWFILLGQVGWLKCTGTADANGSPYTINVAIAAPITSSDLSGGLEKLLPRAELEKLRNLTPLVVEYMATPDVGGVQSNAITFPVLNLKFTKPFRDLSDFTANGDLNGWQRGPAAADPRDLVHHREEDGNGCLFNYTYSETSNGVLLSKAIHGFEVGRKYSFSIAVKRFNLAGAAPRFSLNVNSVPVTAQTDFPNMVWAALTGTFTATSASMSLNIYSHVYTGIGNDYLLDKIYVREV